MPEGEGEKVGGKIGRYLDLADHPLMFALSITLIVIPMMALLTALFKYLNWPGPASLVQHP
jgi:O-antigen/teichoic acid export membrane protein